MRHRKASLKKGGWDPNDMIRAIEDVLKNGLSERRAVEIYRVKLSTLKRRLKEACILPIRPIALSKSSAIPYNKSAMKIFTESEEKELVEYSLRASKMGFGLSSGKLRTLAYEYAKKPNKRFPHCRRGRANSWEKEKQAGKEWFRSFMGRHPELSIRKPEPTSIGHMSAFNKHNVELFYSNVHDVLIKFKFQPTTFGTATKPELQQFRFQNV